jgi:hypothetical protein
LSISDALQAGCGHFIRFPEVIAFSNSGSTTATAHEINDKNDNSDHQQKVDEAACDVKTDAQ